MAATDRWEPRRFITRQHVEDAATARQALRLGHRDVVTDEAAQRAADLGVRLEREATPSPAAGTPDADLRRAVRAAVIAELGTQPPGLDAAIDKVLKDQTPP